MLRVTWLVVVSARWPEEPVFSLAAGGEEAVVADGVAGASGATSAESPPGCATRIAPEPWSASAAGRAITGHITRPATPSRAAMVTIALLRSREPSVVTTFAHR